MIKRVRITIGALLAVMILAAAGTLAFIYLNTQRTNEAHHLSVEICEGVKTNSDILAELLERAEALSVEKIEEGKGNGTTVKELHDFYSPTLKRISQIEKASC